MLGLNAFYIIFVAGTSHHNLLQKFTSQNRLMSSLFVFFFLIFFKFIFTHIFFSFLFPSLFFFFLPSWRNLWLLQSFLAQDVLILLCSIPWQN